MVCEECEKKLTRKQEYAKQRFCSSKCYGIWIKNNKIMIGENHLRYGKKHKEIEEKNGIIFPNYNIHACNWFKFFDKINNTNGQYAVYGGGEYFIENLGYWVDYINFDEKLIIEWGEKYHKLQKKRDKIRQQQIMENFPEFEFIRMKVE